MKIESINFSFFKNLSYWGNDVLVVIEIITFFHGKTMVSKNFHIKGRLTGHKHCQKPLQGFIHSLENSNVSSHLFCVIP